MQFKTKEVLNKKAQNLINIFSLAHLKNKSKKEENFMDIKIVCDRCFKDISKQRLFYRKGHTFGSCTYCEGCHKKIEEEFKAEELSIIVQRNFKKLLREQNEGKVYSLNHKYEDSDTEEFFEVIRRFA